VGRWEDFQASMGERMVQHAPPPTAEGTSAVATDAIISGFTGYLTVRADNSLVEDFL
jgi:hypothetical protein